MHSQAERVFILERTFASESSLLFLDNLAVRIL
jgi:hypothetical protein